jgi:predicted Zn-dependent protease with MMP-like domain
MHTARLQRIADHEIRRTLAKLPAAIGEAAAECLVEPVLMAECAADEESLDEGLLGVFEGCSRADPAPETPDQFPRIRLFLDNLWDYAKGDLRTFREEVRVTYLHELGHYLGFDEAAVEALGLE